MTHSALRIIAGSALLATVSACNFGMRPEDFYPATHPMGASIAILAEGETADRVGELAAVDSIGITVLSEKHIARISWRRLVALDVDRLGRDYDVGRGEQVDAEKRARLKLLSRFPQGISDELLAEILARLGQTSREELR